MREGLSGVDRLVTMSEAAHLLLVHPVTLYESVSTERVPSKKLGRSRLFDPPEMQQWLSQHAERHGSRLDAFREEKG